MDVANYSWAYLALSLLWLAGVALPLVWFLLLVRDRAQTEVTRWRLACHQAQADWQQRWQARTAELDIANEVLKAEVKHRVQVERELEQRRQQGETAQERQELVERLGREMRASLTSVLGLLNVLGDSGLAPAQGELVQMARGRVQMLWQHATNLLGEMPPTSDPPVAAPQPSAPPGCISQTAALPLDAATWRRLQGWAASSHPRLLTELVQVYLHETPKKIAKIRQAAQQADAPRLQKEAHALQVASAAVGAHGLVHLAERLVQFDARPPLDPDMTWFAPLEHEFGRVKTALEQLAGACT